MQKKKIEGVGIFMEGGHFSFDSGLPLVEPVLEEGVGSRRGTLIVEQNAVVNFIADIPRAITPPAMDEVLKEENLSVKRTTRNFIVTMKFPIFETDEDTTAYHKTMWNKTRKAINASREEIKKTF